MTDDRVEKALEYALRYGGIDGAHHKTWVIDQMVRALTGCPMIERDAVDSRGVPYSYPAQGVSAEYRAWVSAACDGGYDWDTGIAP